MTLFTAINAFDQRVSLNAFTIIVLADNEHGRSKQTKLELNEQ